MSEREGVCVSVCVSMSLCTKVREREPERESVCERREKRELIPLLIKSWAESFEIFWRSKNNILQRKEESDEAVSDTYI